jgi:DNA-binding IclR family transcriptional regulator
MRVMQIMGALAEAPDGMTLARLSAKLHEPKTTLFGTLKSLEGEAYISNVDGVYRLGTAAISLAGKMSGSSRFPGSIRWLLAELVARTGETAILGVLSEDKSEVVYVDMILSRSAIRFAATIGSRRPLFSSAIGRAILAFQTDAFIDGYLAHTPLAAFTDVTETDPARIRARLAEIRRDGVITSVSETTPGVGGAAAPIFDRQSRVCAAILVAAPSERVTDRLSELSSRIFEAAREASLTLGYYGPFPAPRIVT